MSELVTYRRQTTYRHKTIQEKIKKIQLYFVNTQSLLDSLKSIGQWDRRGAALFFSQTTKDEKKKFFGSLKS